MTTIGKAADISEPELAGAELDRIAGGSLGEAIKRGVLDAVIEFVITNRPKLPPGR